MRMAMRSLMVTLVIASGYAVAGVSVADLALAAGAAPTIALVAAAALATATLVVAVAVVAGIASLERSVLLPARTPRATARPARTLAILRHALPSPRAPSRALPATA